MRGVSMRWLISSAGTVRPNALLVKEGRRGPAACLVFATLTVRSATSNHRPRSSGLAAMMHVRYPLSLRNVEHLLVERGIDITHETVRYWWNRFGPRFATDIRR